MKKGAMKIIIWFLLLNFQIVFAQEIHVNYLASQDEVLEPLRDKFQKALSGTKYKAQFHPFPLLRSLKNLEDGETQIELARSEIREFKINQTYIRVKTPIDHFTSGFLI